MNVRILRTVGCLALLCALSVAQDRGGSDPTPQDIQTRAEALLERARQLSDIRSPNAPAFRLKATFSFVGTDLETVQGTYSEVWISSSQWRREIVVEDSRRIEVGGPTRMWRLDNNQDFPEQAALIIPVLDFFPPRSKTFKFESISDYPEQHPPVLCASTQPDSTHTKSALCFGLKDGVLLEKVFPGMRPANIVENSCDYGSFQQIGSYSFPREMVCFEDRHRKLDARVVDLSPEPSPDPSLFTPPPGAIEIGVCRANLVVPQRLSHRPEIFNSPDTDRMSWITVWFVIDIKGKPQDVKVLGSLPANKRANKDVMNRVRDWRFKPGTCNGEALPMMMSVRLPSW
jgi:hypothetical protein